MLVAQRWQKIVQLVNERGSIRVTELSTICEVTEETIRRDLDKLESEGKLLRSHGGAVRLPSSQTEKPYMERETMNAEEKRSIAREAVRYVNEHDRIILDASTTAWYMAQLLPDITLTVLTNSIKVAMGLSSKEKIKVISTGGSLYSPSMSYVGPLAERSLSTYHVDKAFVSCEGLHLQRGLSESNELEALIKQKMIDIADTVYVLADHSKFGRQSLAHVASLEPIHHVVTDERTDAAILASLAELSVHVILAAGGT